MIRYSYHARELDWLVDPDSHGSDSRQEHKRCGGRSRISRRCSWELRRAAGYNSGGTKSYKRQRTFKLREPAAGVMHREWSGQRSDSESQTTHCWTGMGRVTHLLWSKEMDGGQSRLAGTCDTYYLYPNATQWIV